MKAKLRQFLCGIFTGHILNDIDRKCDYNEKDKTFTITEHCSKCGKKFSFTAPESKFGL